MPQFWKDPPTKGTAAERAAWHAEFDAWAAEEQARVVRQRTAFASSRGPSRRTLQNAMLERAWALLDAGECEAADALLEFVPEAAATKLLDEFFGDDA